MAKDEFKDVPKGFKKQMYDSYCANMEMYGKPIKPYKEWLKEVESIDLNSISNCGMYGCLYI